MKKKIIFPSHEALMRPLLKDKRFRRRIEAGVQRLKVIHQIVELRQKLKLTQAELGRRIGVSQPFIARLENDETANLSLETIVKIVEALNGELDIRIWPKERAA